MSSIKWRLGDQHGKAYVYEWDRSSLRQMGNTLGAICYNAWSGYSVAMSVTGDRVAVSAAWYRPRVIYEWDGSRWKGESTPIEKRSGGSVSMSTDGKRVVTGSRNYEEKERVMLTYSK